MQGSLDEAEYIPGTQVAHAVPAAADEKGPAGQFAQEVEPGFDVQPVEHNVQLDASVASWYMPAAQIWHVVRS